VKWIAHGGLAGHLPAGAPDVESLDRALDAGADMLELDVAATADSQLALLHDEQIEGHGAVATMDLSMLRAALPGLLTLDEAVAHLRARVPLLLDLKGRAVVEPLSAWLRDHDRAGVHTVCTDDLAALLTLRYAAPATARWRTLPSTRSGMAGHGRRRAIAVATRSRLPRRVARLAAEVDAVGISVDRLALTSRLSAAAHRAGLVVAAWTANTDRAVRSVIAGGADYVTSDLALRQK
jgi:glycerophosphoryl diester phosphodiesterase